MAGVKLLEGYVEVTADAKGAGDAASRQIADEVDRSDGGDRAGKSFGKRLVGGIVGSVAVLKVGQFIGESITAGSDLAETMSKATEIFGEQAGMIDKWTDDSATQLGLSKAAAMDAAAGFGNMFTQLGFVGVEASSMSQKVVTMAADLGSFNNLPTADVADKISAAFRGEYDSLQALIPNINAARVEQEAMAATGKTNAAELTAQEKAAAVLAIVQKDGAAAMGDFARTSEGAANQQKIAAAQTEDLKSSLGAGLLPVVESILAVVTSQFLPMLQDFAKWISENEALVVPLVSILGVLAAAIWIVNIAMTANPIGLIIAGIVLLIAIIVALVVIVVSNWQTIVDFIVNLWNGFIGWITGVMDGFFGWWNGIWAAVGQFIVDVWNGFINWIVGIWNGFINFIVAVIVGYLSFWIGVWQSVASFFSGIWSGIVSFGRDAINNLISFFTGLPGAIMGALSGAVGWLVNVGRDIVAGLRRGIENAWSNLVSWFSGLFGNIIDIAKRILGIASPSLRFDMEVGRQIPAGAERGVKRGMPALNRTIRDMVQIPSVDYAGAAQAATTGASSSGRFASGDRPITVELKQEIHSTDPILGARQSAREVTRYLGVIG